MLMLTSAYIDFQGEDLESAQFHSFVQQFKRKESRSSLYQSEAHGAADAFFFNSYTGNIVIAGQQQQLQQDEMITMFPDFNGIFLLLLHLSSSLGAKVLYM